MFKSLKEKLSGWFKKVTREKEEQPSEEETKEAPQSDEEKKSIELSQKKIIVIDKKREAAVIEPLDRLPVEEIRAAVPPQKEEIIEKIAPVPLAEEVISEKKSEPRKKKESEFPKKKESEFPKKKAVVEEKKEERIDIDKKKEEETALEEKEKSLIEPKKKGFFTAFKEKFTTRKISSEEFNMLFDDLEMILLENNVALEVVDQLRKELAEKIVDKDFKKSEIEEEIRKTLREVLEKMLLEPFDIMERIKEKKGYPFVILFFGINGSGKTTTIAKIASLLKRKGISCVIAAADTFRAASIEQLSMHGDTLDVKVIKHDYGSDPSAVAFDAIKYAKQHGVQAVLIDTAGRMHTKQNLMSEMQKITRVTKPDLKIFIGESITGNDAVEQARSFNEAIGIDGIILSKADVDEKGGTAISVGYVTGKPVLYLGVGQEYGDLDLFEKEKLLSSLGL